MADESFNGKSRDECLNGQWFEALQQARNAATIWRQTLYLNSLARQGECAQHLAYWTADHFDDWCKTLRERGWVEGHAGRMGAGRGRYAYFVRAELPSAMVEISETTGGKGDFIDEIRCAALGWARSDPAAAGGAAGLGGNPVGQEQTSFIRGLPLVSVESSGSAHGRGAG